MKPIYSIIYTAALLFIFSGCKKTELDFGASPGQDKITYSYNGKTYNSGVSFFKGAIVIYIPDEPGWRIYFNSPACAFRVPADISFGINSITNSGCELSLSSGPVDSAQIFFYRTGTLNYSYSDCYNQSFANYGPNGGVTTYKVCTVTGSFNITLSNNKNDLIIISNGSFVFHKVKP